MTMKKQKIAALFAVIAAAGLLTVNVSGLQNTDAEVNNDPELVEHVNTYDPTPAGWLDSEENRSIILVSHDAQNASVTRGDSIITSITLEHRANNPDAEPVVLRPTGTIGVIIPEPYSSMYTSEERSFQLRDNGEIIGAISLSEYVTFSERLVTIPVGEKVTITMQIDMPANMADSVVGTTLPFQPAFEKVSGENVKLYNSILDVEVRDAVQ